MIQFNTLYSGSSGNSTYIGDSNNGILVDIGKNAKQTEVSLKSLGLAPEAVKAVFVTHEHSDHIAGLRVFCNRYKVPVYASNGTLAALESKGHLEGDFPVYIMSDYADIDNMHVKCFHTLHDCAESMGYTVETLKGKKVAVSTDLGIVTDEVKNALKGSHTVLLESNHDINMLNCGPYPYYLKKRILSDHGHLSNEAAAELASELIKNGTRHIILGHLSKDNNMPELAYQTAVARTCITGAREGDDYSISVASRNTAGHFEVTND